MVPVAPTLPPVGTVFQVDVELKGWCCFRVYEIGRDTNWEVHDEPVEAPVQYGA